MPEVERLCDRVGIIREGRLVTVSDIGDLKARALRRIELHFEGRRRGPSRRCRGSVASGRTGTSSPRGRGLGRSGGQGGGSATVREHRRRTSPASRTVPGLFGPTVRRRTPPEGAIAVSGLFRRRSATSGVPDRLGDRPRRRGRDVRGLLPERPESAAALQDYLEEHAGRVQEPDRRRLHHAGRLPAERDVQHAGPDPLPRLRDRRGRRAIAARRRRGRSTSCSRRRSGGARSCSIRSGRWSQRRPCSLRCCSSRSRWWDLLRSQRPARRPRRGMPDAVPLALAFGAIALAVGCATGQKGLARA